jgi:hypothetical protein
MANIKAILISNTNVAYRQNIESFLTINKIPHRRIDDKLYFISNVETEFYIEDNIDPYILSLLSYLPYDFGFYFQKVDLHLEELFTHFNEISIDLNIVESYGGESNWFELKILRGGNIEISRNE